MSEISRRRDKDRGLGEKYQTLKAQIDVCPPVLPIPKFTPSDIGGLDMAGVHNRFQQTKKADRVLCKSAIYWSGFVLLI